MKKLIALVLALAMVATLGLAFAADPPAQVHTIEVKKVMAGETYTAYKIFDVVKSGSNYAYTISSSNPWFTELTTSVTAESNGDYILTSYNLTLQKTSTAGLYNVIKTNDSTAVNAASLASFFAAHTAGKTDAGSATGGSTATGQTTDTVTINVDPDEAGYYFVTTSLGSVCSIGTSANSAEIEEKNSIPGSDKEVKEEDNNTYGDSANARVGDTVNFRITITDGNGTNQPIILHDKMSTGLDLLADTIAIAGLTKDTDYKVITNGTAVTFDGKSYTMDTTKDTFMVVIKASVVADKAAGGTWVVTYNGKLNDNAVYTTDEVNKQHVEYSDQHSTETEVIVKTYKVELLKYDGSDTRKLNLAGAVFQLQDSAGNVIKVIGSGANYKVAKDQSNASAVESFTTVSTGNTVIDGLDVDKTYLLEELQAPSGYNKLTGKLTVSATGDPLAFGVAEAANNAGAELPSTGGIGTTIFYIIGGLLVIGAAVILVARRKAHE